MEWEIVGCRVWYGGGGGGGVSLGEGVVWAIGFSSCLVPITSTHLAPPPNLPLSLLPKAHTPAPPSPFAHRRRVEPHSSDALLPAFNELS